MSATGSRAVAGFKGWFKGGIKGALFFGVVGALVLGGLVAGALYGIPFLLTVLGTVGTHAVVAAGATGAATAAGGVGLGAALHAGAVGLGATIAKVVTFLGWKGILVAGATTVGGVAGLVNGGFLGSQVGGFHGIYKENVRQQDERSANIDKLTQVVASQEMEMQRRLAARQQMAMSYNNPDAADGHVERVTAPVPDVQQTISAGKA